MKAAVIEKYGTITWKEKVTPEVKDNEVLIKITHASICGSDQHIFKGEFHPRTRLPLIPGHEFSGIISETGKNVKNLKPGEHVAVDPIIWCGKCVACQRGQYPACSSLKLVGIDLDGGFAEYISVDESMCYKLNPTIPLKNGALVELLAIGFHASNRAGIKNNDTIAIWGAGKVGQCILQAAYTKTKNSIFLIDVLEKRLQHACKGYPDIIPINSRKEDPLDKIKYITSGRGVDIAFEAVGHAVDIHKRYHPVRGCIQAIRGAGKVCVLGLANEPTPLVMKELIWKEAQLIASRVSHGEFKQVIENMESGKLKPELLITSEIPMNKTQEAFRLLEDDMENQLKVILNI